MRNQPARVHGLPKMHKTFTNISKFRPIIDTTGTSHYLAGKYLAQLLYPLTNNEFTSKDWFEAINRIQDIPSSLFVNGYKYVSFDVKSLFTNVLVKKTIDVILTRTYNDHTISTNLKKRSLKKLILGTCTKTAFSFNNVIYEQKDGVSIGSSLGPVMANIIMTELENKVIKPLINDGTLKFYSRYVDDTLLVVKPQDVSRIHKLLSSFDKNLKFTVDLFENEVPHFLDLEMSPDGISIYWKDTNTGLYVNYTSFVPWTHRTAWIRSLVTRALRTCSSKLPQELKLIKKFASWNDFPRYRVNSIFLKTLQAHEDKSEPNLTTKQKETVVIYFRVPYHGDKVCSF